MLNLGGSPYYGNSIESSGLRSEGLGLRCMEFSR